MDILRAKEIMEILADGVNPMTGEVLPASDSCNQVEVVRAIHAVLKHIDTEPERPKRPQPENAGKPWTEGTKRSCAGCSIPDAPKKRSAIISNALRGQLLPDLFASGKSVTGMSSGKVR